ncbi:MAG: porin family protein [Bacteroidaceae bacterium]|nr:porin family protein [Bacteroidaceae bacterium]
MKKFFGILVVIGLFLATPVAAQFDFGIKAGVNLSQKPTDINVLKNDSKGEAGWFVGPTAKFVFPIVGLGIEANVLYSQKNVAIEDVNILDQSIDLPLYLRYELNLPVVSKFFEPFIAVGPQFGWNIGSKKIALNSVDDVTGLTKRSYNFADSSFSLNFGLGVVLFDHIQIHGNYNLAMGKTAEYKEGVMNSALEILKKEEESKTNTWQISLAYLF